MIEYNLTVVGTGYVGLITGVCFAEKGFNVICVDINQEKVDKLKKGNPIIYEEDLEELMIKNYKEKRIEYTTDYRSVYKNSDIIFICVGTPEMEDGSVNTSGVYEVSKQISENVSRDCIVVIKSTVPMGTSEKVEQYIRENLVNDVRVDVVSNPEFLAQGAAVKDTLQAARIVIGTENEKAREVMGKIYESFNVPILFMDRKSSEMVKYASNNFLALKISYINEIANLCEDIGADIEEVVRGMTYDDRIGKKYFRPGCGYGGSCLTKDTNGLYNFAKSQGHELKTVQSAIQVNQKQKTTLVDKAKKRFKTFSGLNVSVLGLAFKPKTDDLRGAPSVDNIKILLEEGANVKAYDPIAMPNFEKVNGNKIKYSETIQEALKDTDVCFIFTEWDEIKKVSPKEYVTLMKTPVVYDGRNIYDINEMKEQGVEYYSIGR